ncbi:MAG: chloride channel protein [Deltaproteobacteria bacterium]|nr:chloride channel protein [Deltaproteobacteria bacterium]
MRRLRLKLAEVLAVVAHLRLPAPSILPATGALVGFYAGLAAGLFSALIGSIQLLGFGLPRVLRRLSEPEAHPVRDSLARAPWHLEYLVAGSLVALGLLTLARLVPTGGAGADQIDRAETRRRLRVIAFMILGGLALFYPVVALSAVNDAFGVTPNGGLMGLLDETPWALRPLFAGLGGVLIARVVRLAPEARGGGLGQVIQAVSRSGEGVIPTRVGVVKLFASSLTIGTGGSAGREGPIVQMGGSVGSTLAQALGFTRRDLVVLVGCGSAGGIAASFNAPIAGAMFALEIILREFEVRVFAPIMLASVTATMTARAMAGASVERHEFHLRSTSEVLAYVLLGILGGVMAVSYSRGMDLTAALFQGRLPNRASAWLAEQNDTTRCVLGGVIVGLMGIAVPSIMGSGAESLSAATAGQLAWHVLLAAAVFKLIATSVTLGSGASGGTFFPSLFIGGMSGGAFGALLDHLFPGATGGPGSYALVGMAACVAGFTRAPLTAIVIVFELTNDYTAILPLMVACTSASALTQAVLGHAHGPSSLTAAIPDRPVREFMSNDEEPLPERANYDQLREALLRSSHGVVVLVDDQGRPSGLALLHDIQSHLRDESIREVVRAQDLARPLRTLTDDLDLRSARDSLDDWELPAAPVVSHEDPARLLGMIGLSDIRAAARAELSKVHASTH